MSLPKVQVPQPAIFQSDPVEQVFARGMLDRDMSGLSYMAMANARDRRTDDQDTYLKGVKEANQLSAALAMHEEMNKQALEVLKQGVEMSTKLGTPTSTMPIMKMLIPSGADDPGAAAKLQLVLSEIAMNNAKAANTGQDQYSYETQVTPEGVSIETLKGKGRDPATLQQQMALQAQRAWQARQKPVGQGGTGLPPAGSYWMGKTQELNQTRRD